MKKIIAIALLLCCAFCMFSCTNGNMDEVTSAKLDEIIDMFDHSVPTKAEVTTVMTVAGVSLESVATLTTGTVDGKKVTVFENEYEYYASVNNSTKQVQSTVEEKWYYEGKGVSTDKGATWDAAGEDFAVSSGFIKLRFNKSAIVESKYDEDTKTLVMKIAKEAATDVVKDYLDENQKIETELTVTITTSGNNISVVKIEYQIPSHEITVEGQDDKITVQDSKVSITSVYSYSLQDITLD